MYFFSGILGFELARGNFVRHRRRGRSRGELGEKPRIKLCLCWALGSDIAFDFNGGKFLRVISEVSGGRFSMWM